MVQLLSDESSHERFLSGELERLIQERQFACLFWRSIGREIHDRLTGWADSPLAELCSSESSYSKDHLVETLYLWIQNDGGFDPEWLACDDGTFVDDEGNKLPSSTAAELSAGDQLSAYGLWLLKEMLPSLGPRRQILPAPEVSEGHNSFGWSFEDVHEHRTTCLLNAYQALAYVLRIEQDAPMTIEESATSQKISFSELGRAGAKKRHAPMAELKEFAEKLYQAGSWRSASQAARDLEKQIVDHGRTINAHLSQYNAQRTIAGWFREIKAPSSG